MNKKHLHALLISLYIVIVTVTAFMVSTGYCRETQASVLVTIKTDKAEYAVGEELIVTITNISDRPIFHYGICSLTICEHSERGWFCSEKDCYAPQKTILSGSSLEFRDVVNAPFKKNTKKALHRYKFEYYEDSKPGIKTIFSNEFMIKTK